MSNAILVNTVVAEHEVDGEELLKRFPGSMPLDKVKKIVGDLAEKWEDEFSEWSESSSDDDIFKSKILPGMTEGCNIVMYTPDNKVLLYTGDWEETYSNLGSDGNR